MITAGAFTTPLAAAHQTARRIVLGDSIGVGISLVSNLPRLAENSIAIRSKKIQDQFNATRVGATVVLSLGTNDSVGSVKNIKPAIDSVLAFAKKRKIKLIWVGPPCVIKKWNDNVQELDDILCRRLEGQATYISISEDSFCSRDIRARDGVHFTMGGYRKIWARIQDELEKQN